MQLSRGARLRSYEVLGPLGAGGMGAVYRARDSKLGREVAVKVLQEKLGGSAEHMQRFKREARAASALNHPNIVTIFEIDEVEGAPFIAMELVEGESLRDLLQLGALPARRVLDIATQIAEGLAAAHERGIIHRDLKPENVMITPAGHVKIVDFGLARMASPAGADESTASFTGGDHGRIVGTASYMSPEQANGAPDIDFRSDQFSFGSILYELTTGRRAFHGKTAMETLASIMRDEPEPVERLNPSLPAPLRWIIDRCLSKEAKQRYDSTRDLARELRTIRERLPETWPPGTRMARASLPVRRFVAAAIVAAVLGTLGTMVYRYSARPQETVAVAPFNHDKAGPDGEFFSFGLSEAVRQRLADVGVHVIDPRFSISTVPDGDSVRRIVKRLRAALLLTATVKRSNDDLRVTYELVENATGRTVSERTIAGTMQDIWSLRDRIADAVAADLEIEPRKTPTGHGGLQSQEELETYLVALGVLDRATEHKQVDVALHHLHSLLETSPDSSLVHATLGRAYYTKFALTSDRKWSEKALQASRRAFALDPDSADTLITLGIVESIHGNYDESVTAFQQAMMRMPTSAMAAVGLAQTLGANNRYEEAERMFRRGVALNPEWWFAHNGLATLYWQRGKYDAALLQYEEVIRLDPDSSTGYSGAGAVLLTKGHLDDAAAMFRKAISLSEDATAYANLGYCFFYLGQYDKAVEANRIAVRLRPARSNYWVDLGDACAWSSKHRAEARAAYESAVQRAREELAINPRIARAHAALAVALARIGDPAAARQAIRRAMELAPQNPEHLFPAARVANLSGAPEEALSLLKRTLAAKTPRHEVERHPEFADLRETEAGRALLKTLPPGIAVSASQP
jgi:serine/threonine-protein kinase